MKSIRACSVACLLVACSSGHYATVDPGHAAFVFPHHLAEGKGEGSDRSSAAGSGGGPGAAGSASASSGSGASAAAALPPRPVGSAPDPEPLSMREQWEYQLLFQNGAPSVESVTKRVMPKPVPTPRRMGRFALELWIGHELVDRVRFDFPLLAAEERPLSKRRPLRDPPSLAPHAIARIRVSLPASPRATRLVLVDRESGQTQALPWPPDATAGGESTAVAPTPPASGSPP